jgi:hypothetical protein
MLQTWWDVEAQVRPQPSAYFGNAGGGGHPRTAPMADQTLAVQACVPAIVTARWSAMQATVRLRSKCGQRWRHDEQKILVAHDRRRAPANALCRSRRKRYETITDVRVVRRAASCGEDVSSCGGTRDAAAQCRWTGWREDSLLASRWVRTRSPYIHEWALHCRRHPAITVSIGLQAAACGCHASTQPVNHVCILNTVPHNQSSSQESRLCFTGTSRFLLLPDSSHISSVPSASGRLECAN